jgi:hypothetical protein
MKLMCIYIEALVFIFIRAQNAKGTGACSLISIMFSLLTSHSRASTVNKLHAGKAHVFIDNAEWHA